MPEWIVYRSGWNGANQPSASCPKTVAVARVRAADESEACALAARKVTVYNNQHLSARPAEEVDAEEDELEGRVTLL